MDAAVKVLDQVLLQGWQEVLGALNRLIALHEPVAWLSNILNADFCVEALREAIVRYGVMEAVNTDQGSEIAVQQLRKALFCLT